MIIKYPTFSEISTPTLLKIFGSGPEFEHLIITPSTFLT